MRRYFSSESVRNADVLAAERVGVPGVVLMENAGRGAAEIIMSRFPDAKNFLILCGGGNNGGDGFVAARHLRLAGKIPSVIATRAAGDYKKEAEYAARSAKNSLVEIFHSEDLNDGDISSRIRSADVVVDALLGTGAAGEPRGEAARLIKLLDGRPRVVALDVPSGVNADTGEAPGVAVTAEMTITFLAEKPGLAVAPGALRSGAVVAAGIGVDPSAVLGVPPVMTGWGADDIPLLAPGIPMDAHKGSKGSLLIIGGSSNYRGAPLLSALAALRSGCGLVALAIPASLATGAAALVPEAIFIPLPESEGHISFKGFPEAIAPYIEKFDAIAIGPGLGRSRDAESAALFAHGECGKPIVIDADATGFGYRGARHGVVATPHAGEAARVLGVSPREVESQRFASCAALAGRFGAVALKGFHTLVSDGNETRVILEGGPELAVPGSGDALTGATGAFMASGMSPIDAATLGAIVHGAAGSARSKGSSSGLLAREIAEGIRDALHKA